MQDVHQRLVYIRKIKNSLEKIIRLLVSIGLGERKKNLSISMRDSVDKRRLYILGIFRDFRL